MKRAAVILLFMSFCWMAIGQDLKKSKKVAEIKQIGKNKVVVCDRSLLKDTVVLPLSYFTDELHVVKLENKDEALVAETPAVIGEKYILIKGQKQNPYKLFDKTGKFITNIGSYGKGPNEYQNVYDQQLDEKNNRIYLLPWQSDKILVFDLTGKSLDPIRLPVRVPKGIFWIDDAGTNLSVTALPFNGIKYVAWSQKLSGEVINGIEPGFLSITPDFSNEMMATKNTNQKDILIFTFVPRKDTLYHYDDKMNQLIPQFTLDYKNRKSEIHTYHELPHHYMGSISEPKQISASTTITTNNLFYVVEKSTMKGTFFTLKNDYLADEKIGYNTPPN